LKNYEESGHFSEDGKKLTGLCVVEQSQIEEIGSLLRDKEISHTQRKKQEKNELAKQIYVKPKR